MEVGGFKIGFFGILAPETDVLSLPGQGIEFAPVIEVAVQLRIFDVAVGDVSRLEQII